MSDPRSDFRLVVDITNEDGTITRAIQNPNAEDRRYEVKAEVTDLTRNGLVVTSFDLLAGRITFKPKGIR